MDQYNVLYVLFIQYRLSFIDVVFVTGCTVRWWLLLRLYCKVVAVAKVAIVEANHALCHFLSLCVRRMLHICSSTF